jgi:hypothetical protein
VYTVTGVPPPCGVKEMLSTLTPIRLQSSEDASLNITGRPAVCAAALVGATVETVPPPPQADSDSAIAVLNRNRGFLGIMIGSLLS